MSVCKLLMGLLIVTLSGVAIASEKWHSLEYHPRSRQLLLEVKLNGVSAKAAVVLSGSQSYVSGELAKKLNFDGNASKAVVSLDSDLTVPVALHVSDIELNGIDLILDRDVFAGHVLTWDIPSKRLRIGSSATLMTNRVPFDYKTGKFFYKTREMWLPLLASVSEEVAGTKSDNTVAYSNGDKTVEVQKGKYYVASSGGSLDLFTGSGAKSVAGATFFGHQTIEVDLINDTISFIDENIYRVALIWKYQFPSLDLEVSDGFILVKGHSNAKYMEMLQEKRLIGAKLAKVGDIVVEKGDLSDSDRFLTLFAEYRRKPELGFEKDGRFFYVQP